MSIQSLSIVVPSKRCINNCKFCVSRTHKDIVYEDKISNGIKISKEKSNFKYSFSSPSDLRYRKALRYAKELGCTTVMLTGESEPQQNMPFLRWFLNLNSLMNNLFNNIEIQTTGKGLDKDTIFDLAERGINTFSISVSSFNDLTNNAIITNNPFLDSQNHPTDLKKLCSWIKNAGCLLRLSLNMSNAFYGYDCYPPEVIFKKCKEEFGANQVTLRQLYTSDKECPQNDWIRKNCNHEKEEEYFNYIKINGIPLERLPYGNIKYSVDGVGTVADDDCMSKKNLDEIRYLILRPDCHLYTRWDDPASIIF